MLDKPGDEKAQRSVYDSGGILFKLFGDGDHRTQLSGRADAQAEYSIILLRKSLVHICTGTNRLARGHPEQPIY
jgi:hypothetical protein